MSTWEAILLGIIQGLTEFLPVSSSGHLVLAQHLLGFSDLDQYVLFDLVCHLGTLLAILCVFFKPLTLIMRYDWKQAACVALGTLPLFPLVLLIKPIKSLFDEPQYLGFFFLFTALVLYLGIKWRPVGETPEGKTEHPWRDALLVGVAQAIAILPGVSRSGMTISAARTLGWGQAQAVQFSFMLAIPAILGGVTLEIYQLIKASGSSMPALPFQSYLWGFLVSFGVGYFALNLLIKLALKDRFLYFVWYCLLIGIFTIGYTRVFNPA